MAEPSAKVQTIKGRIVAYSNDPMCLNGNAYWSMLILVQDNAPRTSPQYVAVRFSLVCKEFPKWLTRKPPIQNFRLKRDEVGDAVLKEFFECAAESSQHCPKLPMWKRVPSAQHEKLPFGQTVPSYQSVDLPLAPVV